MTRVACLGSVFYDQVFYVDVIPATPVKVIAKAHCTGGGGMAATAAVAVAALGGESIFWGRVGTDAAGTVLLGWLKDAGVDVADVVPSAASRTSTSAVLVDAAGERLLAAFPGSGFDEDTGWLPVGRLATMDAVLCDVRWARGATEVLEAARRIGVPTILDADIATPEVLSWLIERADHVIFSRNALVDYAGTPDLGTALARAALRTEAQIGVTLGREGCALLLGGQVVLVPGYGVRALDTTGAGDTFHGAYALAVAEGQTAIRAANFANAAAAVKCSLGGGWQGMPRRRQVQDFMETKSDVTLGG